MLSPDAPAAAVHAGNVRVSRPGRARARPAAAPDPFPFTAGRRQIGGIDLPRVGTRSSSSAQPVRARQNRHTSRPSGTRRQRAERRSRRASRGAWMPRAQARRARRSPRGLPAAVPRRQPVQRPNLSGNTWRGEAEKAKRTPSVCSAVKSLKKCHLNRHLLTNF